MHHVKTDKNSLEADEGSAVGCGALWENQNPGGGSLKSLNNISARLSSRPNLGHLGSTHLRLISATADLLDSELFRSTKIVCMNLFWFSEVNIPLHRHLKIGPNMSRSRSSALESTTPGKQ